MRFGSVCSGIEAASVAWGPLGWEAAWFSEIEPFPSAVLAHHYPDTANLGDMTTLPERIRAGEVEAPDVFCGGTPCQAFSVAGLRRSLDDARGNLSLTFCEIADAIDHVRLAGGQPASLIFWENVPGVLSTADNAFGCFLAQLCGGDEPLHAPDGWPDAGCVSGPTRTAAWRILDAQFFGLAQRRRRVFVVASARNDFDPAAVLFEFDGVRRDTAPSREAGQRVARGATESFGIRSANTSSNGWGIQRELTHTLDTASPQIVGTIGCNTGPNGHGFGDFLNNQAVDAGHILAFGGGQNCAQTDVSTALHAHPGGSRLDFQTETFIAHTLRGEGFDASEDGTGRDTPLVPVAFSAKDYGGDAQVDLSPTLRAGGHTNSHANAGVMPAVAFQSSQSGVRIGETHATLDANNGPRRHNGALVGMAVRRLTPVECERLQGFPDGYTAIPWRGKPTSECPDGPRYKALGNSWAVPVVRWIGRRISAAVWR